MRTLADLQRAPDAAAPLKLPLHVDNVRTFDTPEFAGMQFLEVHTKTALNRVKGMGFAWSINPYRGCSHACSYCFARPTHTYLNMSPLGDFERKVVVKTNLVEVLERELRRASWQREHVAMGTNTDNYQRCEGRYRLMPGVIRALGASGTPFSILTKGTLVTRDLDLLAAANEEVDVGAAFTVGMLDENLWRSAEPGTPSPKARLDAVRALNEAGIPTGVMLAPIMPGLNDGPEQLAALVDAAAAAHATHISPIVLHLRPVVRDVFFDWLAQVHPALVQRYRGMYRGANAPKSYREEVAELVGRLRRDAWRRHGTPAARRRRTGRPEPSPESDSPGDQQLSLF